MKDRSNQFWMAIRLIPFLFIISTVPTAAFEVSLRAGSAEPDLERSLKAVSLVFSAKREDVSDPQDILAAAQADYGRLVGALYEQGFYGPVVSILVDGREASTIPPLARLTTVTRVDVTVSTGKAFRLGTAEIAPLAKDTVVPPNFQSGATAQASVIRDAASAGIDGWRAIGHAKARIDQQDVTADHSQAQLDVRLGIDPGPRVRFGDLNIAGDSAVRAKRIREIAGIPTGDVFDPVVLDRAATRLRRAGSFSSVALREAESLEAGDTMDVDLAIVDAKPRRFGFGAELQSAEGVTVSGFWMHRNLLGGAERLRIEGEVSGLGGDTNGLDYHLRAGLTRPSTFTTDTDLYVLGEIEQLDEPHYFSRQGNLELGITRYFSELLTAEAGIAYRYSDVQDDFGSRQFSHISLPFAATWERRDDVLNPSRGFYLHAEAMPFLGLGSSESGGRGYMDARVYRSFGADDGAILAGRLQFGSVLGSSIAATPPDLLFVSGGSGTVRGHSYQSLTIASGPNETGGRSFVGVTGEARLRITDTIGAVAFYDAGYIGANSWIDNTGSWHSGAGLGIRYQTGIGPIRLDIATPVTGSTNDGIQIYVGIGQAF